LGIHRQSVYLITDPLKENLDVLLVLLDLAELCVSIELLDCFQLLLVLISHSSLLHHDTASRVQLQPFAASI
jgi:hypothetical protein